MRCGRQIVSFRKAIFSLYGSMFCLYGSSDKAHYIKPLIKIIGVMQHCPRIFSILAAFVLLARPVARQGTEGGRNGFQGAQFFSGGEMCKMNKVNDIVKTF